jgi:hypothetical protein
LVMGAEAEQHRLCTTVIEASDDVKDSHAFMKDSHAFMKKTSATENHFLPLFWYKNNMIPAISCCMGKTLVLSHWEHPISWRRRRRRRRRRLEVPFDHSTQSNLRLVPGKAGGLPNLFNH